MSNLIREMMTPRATPLITGNPPPAAPPRVARDIEDGAFAPTPQELERLLFTIETSHQINKRFHYFLWAQGVLQSFLPHQTMITVAGNLEAEQYEVDVFSSDATSEEQQPELWSQAREMAKIATRLWIKRGRMPLSYSAEDRSQTEEDPVLSAIWEIGLGNTLAHGTRDLRGANSSFFILGRMARPPKRRVIEQLNILLPFMHFALHRYFLHEGAASPGRNVLISKLSAREIQIMRGVRDGLTNMEIGTELNISPLTVKNHIQRILRKLEVNNRAQAVAHCLASQVFNENYTDHM